MKLMYQLAYTIWACITFNFPRHLLQSYEASIFVTTTTMRPDINAESTQWVCPRTPSSPLAKQNKASSAAALSDSHLRLPSSTPGRLLPTRLADLIRADPFTFDGPRTEALMVGIIACKVTVLDQAPASMPALEMDDFVLVAISVVPMKIPCVG